MLQGLANLGRMASQLAGCTPESVEKAENNDALPELAIPSKLETRNHDQAQLSDFSAREHASSGLDPSAPILLPPDNTAQWQNGSAGSKDEIIDGLEKNLSLLRAQHQHNRNEAKREKITHQQELSAVQAENTRLQERIVEKQGEIECLRQEIKQLLTVNDKTKQKIEGEAKKEAARLKKIHDEEMEKAQAEKQEAIRNFEQCKTEIFSSRVKAGTTGEELGEAYTKLYRNITKWVDPGFAQVEHLLQILGQCGTTGTLANPVNLYRTGKDDVFIEKNPGLEMVVLQSFIWRHLSKNLLGQNIVHPGLTDNMEQLMDDLDPEPRPFNNFRKCLEETVEGVARLHSTEGRTTMVVHENLSDLM
jgi:hypothetical protein